MAKPDLNTVQSRIDPTYPRILKDRDQFNDWYLDEDIIITLQNGHILELPKGFRFDSHSVPFFARWWLPKFLPSPASDDNRYPGNDIYVALVHDALVALDHWHRYNRKFEDDEYWILHQLPEYKMTETRAFWMSLAVSVNGWLRWTMWGDDRGTPKAHSRVTVHIEQSDYPLKTAEKCDCGKSDSSNDGATQSADEKSSPSV